MEWKIHVVTDDLMLHKFNEKTYNTRRYKYNYQSIKNLNVKLL